MQHAGDYSWLCLVSRVFPSSNGTQAAPRIRAHRASFARTGVHSGFFFLREQYYGQRTTHFIFLVGRVRACHGGVSRNRLRRGRDREVQPRKLADVVGSAGCVFVARGRIRIWWDPDLMLSCTDRSKQENISQDREGKGWEGQKLSTVCMGSLRAVTGKCPYVEWPAQPPGPSWAKVCWSAEYLPSSWVGSGSL